MSIAKDFDEIDKHLDYAMSYLNDLKTTVDNELEEAQKEINDFKEIVDKLEEVVEDLTFQTVRLEREKAFLELELIEATNEVMKLRYELDISRQVL
jgi:chromosome segregation ATPase